ncbi:MAG: DUF86 domain-containing protein [Clostridiales Family XIII bacterium]|nr:DUF86 domain-containing protein [Clostridiales Family XIII bacterium]
MARLLDEGFTAAHGDIPWHKMRGLRNRIVHDYGGIDQSLIRDIINGNLAELTFRLGKLTRELN